MEAGQSPESRQVHRADAGSYSLAQRAGAWGVHLLTASGAIVGVLALLASGSGRLREAALWMLLALFIDAIDGSFARLARVKEVLPGTDGRTLDDVIDFLNYVIVPIVFLVQADLVAWPAVVAAPVLASAYGFSQTDAKTDDHFFKGFPSYWNVVALYAFVLPMPPALLSTLLLVLSVMVFVPIKYVYPSRTPVLQRTTLAGGATWTVALLVALVRPPARELVLASLLFPAYYVVLSLVVGGLARRR